MVILVQLFIVMFGLDLSFVILVPERKRGIDTGIQENFDSLFDLDIRVKPEYDFGDFLSKQGQHALGGVGRK